MRLASPGSAARRATRLAAVMTLALLPAGGAARARTPGVQTHTEQDGLPGSRVADVTQGPDGRMWFLTDAGVVAYHGAGWETFDLDAGRALRGGVRFAIEADGTGRAVTAVATLNAGLALFVDGAWVRVDRRHGLPTDTVHALPAVGDELLIGTDQGLWSWRSGELAQRFVPPDGGDVEIRAANVDHPPGLDGATRCVRIVV